MRYRAYAEKTNKSWRQAAALVDRHLLPKWGKLQAADIARADIKAMMGRLADTPTQANAVMAAASAIFSWAIREEVGGIKINPCSRVEQNETAARERVLSDTEIAAFYSLLTPQLRMILLTGQRPGEVQHMRLKDIRDGFWEQPGAADGDWPGTKNHENHRVWLPAPAQEILAENKLPWRGQKPSTTMSKICAQLKVPRATPHDLRRTFATFVTRLGFGKDAMNRILNHRDRSVGSVYDRYTYAAEDKAIMTSVASEILRLVEGGGDSGKVVPLVKRRKR
jgi:integrase